MIRHISFICIVLLLTFTTNNTAFCESSIVYSEQITIQGCEFSVIIPAKTTQKKVSVNGIENVVAQSVYDGESPFMKAECLLLSDPKDTIINLKSILHNQAQNNGIKSPEITIQETGLGVVGTFSGLRKVMGNDARFYGKIVVGEYSLIFLMVSELAAKFPSDKASYFIHSVKKINKS